MGGFVLQKIGNCRKCQAEVAVWLTPKGKTMLTDPHRSIQVEVGHECPPDKIDDLVDLYHYRENGGCPEASTSGAVRHRYLRGERDIAPGKAHLCRACSSRMADGGCILTDGGGSLYLETWFRLDLKADRSEAQFGRDFTQACTGFVPMRKRPEPVGSGAGDTPTSEQASGR